MFKIVKVTNNNKITNTDFGGKALGLSFLQQHNFNVPTFYLLSFQVLKQIENKQLETSKLVESWIREFSIKPNSLWAVRSSANVEDSKSESYAGLFETKTNVQISDLPKAIESVLLAYTSVNEKNYLGKTETLTFGIVIQEMIMPDFAGIAFSHNPMNVAKNEIIINLIAGLGENLVSGKEEAFVVKIANDKITYSYDNEIYYGEIFKNNQLEKISITKDSFKVQIEPFVKELSKKITKLSSLKKMPVDVEFAIANGLIYWLQVRPITTGKFEHETIWDNSNIGENYPGITLPLSASFVQYTYYIAYNQMLKFIGVNSESYKKMLPLLKNMAGNINGSLYYNVTSWQKLLSFLPFGDKISKQYTKSLGMEDAGFDSFNSKSSLFSHLKLIFNLLKAFVFFNKHKLNYEKNFNEIITNYKNELFENKSHSELIVEYYKLEKQMLEHWIAPMLNGLFTLIVSSLLKNVVKKSGLEKSYPNFANDILFSQGELISLKIVREFQLLIADIQSENALYELFLQKDEPEIMQVLESDFKEFKLKIETYIENYGERCDDGELKMEILNYKENPLGFISFLKKNSKVKLEQVAKTFSFDYKSILQKEFPINKLKQIAFKKLINWNINLIRNRENFRFMRTKAFAVVRRIFRQIDVELLKNNLIEEKGDSLYLKFDELIEKPVSSQFKRLILERKNEYLGYETLKIENRYLQKGDKFSTIEQNTSQISNNLKGIGCSSGILTKKVIVLTDSNIENLNIADSILVSHYFEPGWINLFSKAAGIISEKGNLLSHTAILCREMGIPSIVAAKGILKQLKTGDLIKMNGATGEIERL